MALRFGTSATRVDNFSHEVALAIHSEQKLKAFSKVMALQEIQVSTLYTVISHHYGICTFDRRAVCTACRPPGKGRTSELLTSTSCL